MAERIFFKVYMKQDSEDFYRVGSWEIPKKGAAVFVCSSAQDIGGHLLWALLSGAEKVEVLKRDETA